MSFRRPTPCRRPLPKVSRKSIKIRSKFRPTKQCRKVPKVAPNGNPESAQNQPKSALDGILRLPDVKNAPPEGPSEQTCNSERFWDPLGQQIRCSRLYGAQILTFWPDLEKSSFRAPFSQLFGPQIGHDADFGRLLGRFRAEKAGSEKQSLFGYLLLCDNGRKRPPKVKVMGPEY